jgi:DNA-binding GntR family transcriptional regulator
VLGLEPVADRPQSLTEIAFDRIREAIVNRTLPPGTRVSESMLGDMLHVSKTPVREALLRLCHVGLVEPTTRGLRVVLPNRDIIRSAYELRSGLEFSAARLAAERADTVTRQSITNAARMSLRSAQAADATSFADWDLSFHKAVGGASGNRLLEKAVEDSVVLALTLRSRDTLTTDDSVHCGKQHVQIAKAITTGDATSAGQQMFEHITEVLSFVLSGTTTAAS